jgi:hypothetical protein
VGLANMKYFLLFLVYIFTMAMYALALIAGRFFSCVGSGGANAVLAMHARARAAAAGSGMHAGPAGALLVGGLALPGLHADAAVAAAAAAAAASAPGSGGVGRLLLEEGAAAVADAVAAAAAAGDALAAAAAPGQQPPPPVVLSFDPSCDVTGGQMLAIIWSVIIAVLFAIFTGCLFGDQVGNILSGTTGIDRLKGHAAPAQDSVASEADGEGAGLTTGGGGRRRVHRVWHALGEVFGGDPAVEGVRLHWFLPTPIVYKDPEALTGFCFRDVPRPRTLEEQEAV